MPQRLKVIVSAYACEPGRGSEPGTSYEWCMHLARYHDLTVITRENQRTAIEKETALRAATQPVPRFVYFDLPGWVLWLKRRLPATHVWYYSMWQHGAEKVVSRLVSEERFDLAHHMSWSTFRFHTPIWGHGLATVWGPIAGAEICPWSMLPWKYPSAWIAEFVRNVFTIFQASRFGRLRARARRTTITISVSHDMRRACERLGITTRMLSALAVTPPPLYQREKPEGRPLRFLFVGRVVYWKGVELAIHALDRSQTDACFDICGEGPFISPGRKLVRRLGLGQRVSFLGRVAYEKMLQAYRDYDVLLFPSLHDSGGNVVAEAMSHGMPVICLDRGGPGYFVLHDETGIKIPDGGKEETIQRVSDAIRTYDSNRNLIMVHGAGARKHVEAEFTWLRRAAQMEAIYREAFAIHTTRK